MFVLLGAGEGAGLLGEYKTLAPGFMGVKLLCSEIHQRGGRMIFLYIRSILFLGG